MIRESEVEKYQRCYASDSYKMGRRRWLRMKKDLDVISTDLTLLDVGSGRGETIEYARERGIDALGLEIVPELTSDDIAQGSITAIPFHTCDVVTCYDVLEHLPPEDVDKALDELFRVAKHRLFLTVSGNPAERGDDVLHMSIHTWTWWEQKFRDRCPDGIFWLTTYCTEKDWHWSIEKRVEE